MRILSSVVAKPNVFTQQGKLNDSVCLVTLPATRGFPSSWGVVCSESVN